MLYIFSTSLKCDSQEMHIGIGTGLIGDFQFQYPGLNIIGLYEIIPNHSFPKHAFVSFQTNPGIIVEKEQIIGAFPILMNFNIGNKFRVSPNVGGFYWTTKRGGVTAGLNLQYSINEKFNLFINSQYLLIIYKEYYPSHFGTGSYQHTSQRGLNLSLGLKYRIKKGST